MHSSRGNPQPPTLNDSRAYNLKCSCVMCNLFQNGAHVLCCTRLCYQCLYFLYFQPQLEGFFACLDIWTVFLDYLIGKVANARSDKLAEAEATVSRSVLTYNTLLFCSESWHVL